ncbi:MAG: TraB/GumN family protein [Nitrospirae bacterium]|nr:TraB/GumN family protein [Nitrospirota bacterium]
MKSLKQGLLHLFFFIFCIICMAAAGSVSLAAEKQQNFLWRVTAPNSTAYILGSIHLMKPEMYPLNPVIESAFRSSDSLVVEVNLTALDISKAAGVISANAAYTDSRTLRSSISETNYRLAEAKLRETGLDISIFQKTKPWMVAMTLMDISMRRLGFDPAYGIDNHFLRRSGTKRIFQLENFDFQISLLNSFSDKEQEMFLLYTIKDLENLQSDMDRLIVSWQRGDAASLEKLLLSGMAGAPELNNIYRKLFTERNFTMTSKIESILSSRGTYFIVVGAGHLVGKTGIVNLLKQKGFNIQQL